MGSKRGLRGSWSIALIAAALAGLGVLAAAASLFGGVAGAPARDVGLNCTFLCFLGPVGVGAAFGALYFEGIRRQIEENEAADAARRSHPGYTGYDGPTPGNDGGMVY